MPVKVLEREVSKKWVEAHIAGHKGDYAFRIHDCPWSAKPFDCILFTSAGISWALEFKVDRRKSFRYTIEELPTHQLRALQGFRDGKSRKSKVVIYHMITDTWHEMEVIA